VTLDYLEWPLRSAAFHGIMHAFLEVPPIRKFEWRSAYRLYCRR